MKNKTTKWEEELEDKYSFNYGSLAGYTHTRLLDDIKYFIKKILAKQKQSWQSELIEKIEKMSCYGRNKKGEKTIVWIRKDDILELIKGEDE